jgi:UDP-GlcNAc3NAcA epimerase
MVDALAFAAERAKSRSDILNRLQLDEKHYLLATVHRAENTDDPVRLQSILAAFAQIEETIVFPLHPRTRQALEKIGRPQNAIKNIKLLAPVGYLDMVRLEQGARMILTDSGGIQKEAYWLGVPCITLRDETEWVETVDTKWNKLVGANSADMIQTIQSFQPQTAHPSLYGDGHAAERIVRKLT